MIGGARVLGVPSPRAGTASDGVLGLVRIAPPAELVPMFVWGAWVLPIMAAELVVSAGRLPVRSHGSPPPPNAVRAADAQ